MLSTLGSVAFVTATVVVARFSVTTSAAPLASSARPGRVLLFSDHHGLGFGDQFAEETRKKAALPGRGVDGRLSCGCSCWRRGARRRGFGDSGHDVLDRCLLLDDLLVLSHSFFCFYLDFDLVAGGGFFTILGADTLNPIVRGVELGRRDDDEPNLAPLLYFTHGVAFLVQQERGDRNRQNRADFGAGFFQSLFFEETGDRECRRLNVANRAESTTPGADDSACFTQRCAQTLTRHFHQAKSRDSANLHACTVDLQRVAHAVFNRALALLNRHVDVVDDNQAADVPQSQLATDLVGRFEVGI